MAYLSAENDRRILLLAMMIKINNVYMNNKEKCLSCSSVPENVMVLSCNHCICLPCASNQACKQADYESYFICCNRCKESTEIDKELYKQLMILVGESRKNEKKRQNVLNKQLLYREERKLPNYGFDQDLERTCNWHNEYPIMYVCKTCNDAFICPQCLLNGSHKGHEANAIQKEGQRLKGKLQQDLSKISQKIQELEKLQQIRLTSIEQRRRQLQKLKITAKRQYDEIKEAIIREENAVIAKCNELIATHQKQEQSFKFEIANQIKMYERQRINLVDLLNPVLIESISGQSRALHKIIMVNLVESYKKFVKLGQRDKENYIKIDQETIEEDREAIESLTRKIDKINIANFYHPQPEIFPKEEPTTSIKKCNYPKNEAKTSTILQSTSNKHVSTLKANKRKDNFFNLL